MIGPPGSSRPRQFFEPALSMNRPTPDPSQEGSRPSSASRQFPSWEGSGVGSWSQCTASKSRGLSMNHSLQIRMTNDEIRRNDKIRMTKPATALLRVFGHSRFGFLSSFVVRHSSFNDFYKSGSWSHCMREAKGGSPGTGAPSSSSARCGVPRTRRPGDRRSKPPVHAPHAREK